VNNASGHTLADAVRGAPPETHSSEGGGVWAEYLPNAALTSNDLFLDDANALVPVWLGGRGDRPAFAMDATGFFGRYLFTVIEKVKSGVLRTGTYSRYSHVSNGSNFACAERACIVMYRACLERVQIGVQVFACIVKYR